MSLRRQYRLCAKCARSARAARLFCGHTPDIHVSESGNFKVVIDNRGETDAILGEVLMRGLNQKKQLTIGTIDRECCRAAFIRGAFLASGTVTDPDRVRESWNKGFS